MKQKREKKWGKKVKKTRIKWKMGAGAGKIVLHFYLLEE